MLALLMILFGGLAWLWNEQRALRRRLASLERIWGEPVGTAPLSSALAKTSAFPSAPRAAPTSVAAAPRAAVAPPERAPTPTPDTEQTAPTPRPRARRIGFEEMFGRRLPIWAGGVTLAVAGLLIVKYSIDHSLVSPAIRVVLGLIFGTGLIAGAEIALRHEGAVRDPRVRQALSGAGIATLFAAILVAANVYHLVGPIAAFAGLASVTALAAMLSLRFGAPSAVLGLVGGLAAPALIGSTAPNIPLLTLYLLMAIGGLCALARQQRWWWLGAAALIGGFGWGAALILDETLGIADTLSVGLLTLALAIGLPALILGERRSMVRLGGGVLGCAQLAALVATGGFAPLDWGLFGLLSIAIVWLSRRDAVLADVPALGLGVAILLAFAWTAPTAGGLALLLAAMTAIYGAPAAIRLWRADAHVTDAPSLAAIALSIGLLPPSHLGSGTAWTALVGAALAAGIAALGWGVSTRRADSRFATLAAACAASLALAALLGWPNWTWAPVTAVLALGLDILAKHGDDHRVERCGWGFAGVATLLLLGVGGIERLTGEGAPTGMTLFAAWAVPAAVAAILAWRAPTRLAWIFQPAAVLIGYGAAAQLVPTIWLPVIPASIALGLALGRRTDGLPGLAAAALLMAGWAIAPLATWLGAGSSALSGTLVPVTDWPSVGEMVRRVALPAATLAIAGLAMPMPPRVRRIGLASAGAGLILAAHVASKQLFAITTAHDFVRHAMAERTLWEIGLAALALVAWRRRAGRAAMAIAATSVSHFVWFTVLVDNPLAVDQTPGPWLPIAYATAGALIWRLLSRGARAVRIRDWATMALVTLGSFTLLRQTLHAPMILGAGIHPTEQIGRSVLAILLAGGFLWIGIARRTRDWRVGSLILMLVAVIKVFAFDAAGLDGLARIGSFAALGFSLIGVGWIFSRFLSDEPSQVSA